LLRKLLILIVSVSPACLLAQETARSILAPSRISTTLRITPPDSIYSLGSEFITPGSDSVVLDSRRALQRGVEYDIRYRTGGLTLNFATLRRILADTVQHFLTVSFDRFPFMFRPQYALREIVPLKDSAGHVTRKVQLATTRLTMDDLFGSGLQKSGSIFRGLQVGSNRDLTINSGFRMQLSGKLSSELDIVAALTDENVPLQPEGTTQTLQELDKVFIELRNPRYGATLGDFVYDIGERQGGEFGRLSRKLQGVVGSARAEDIVGKGSSLAVTLAGATARGKFTTNQLQATEGNQGPYRLTGQDPGSRPIIIAGSERVYINGQLMTRGETNDYTIDYSTGEVYFSAKRLMTNATRITVDFEYTDRQFVRNLLGATATLDALDNRLHFTSSITQEADDPSSPIDIALDDSLRAIIAASGGDRFKASISGIRDLGRDSVTLAGKGQYILRDTLLNGGQHRPFLVYAPGDVQATYSASFSFVNQMPGDSLGYERGASGGFVLAGLGKGSYLPVQFLPVPELHRVANGILNFVPASDVTIAAEYAFSDQNINRLSNTNESDRQGGAYKLRAEYHPKDVVIGGTHLGELGIILSDRFVDRRFLSLDRWNEIEFDRAWNLDPASGGDEEIREVGVNYSPYRTLRLGGTYGFLERKGSIRSDRSTFNAALTDSSAPRLSYSSEFVRSQDFQFNNTSAWIRQRGDISYPFSLIQPALRMEMEDRQQNSNSSDSLAQGSFKFLEIAPGLSLLNMDPVRMSAEVQIRSEDSASNGAMTRAIHAVTQLYDLQLRQWSSLTGSVALSLRKSEVADAFASKGSPSSNTMLIRSQVQYAPWRRAVDADALYEFARERSAAMRRVFIRVPKGTGNYRYVGDVNQNGVADDNEFEQTRFDGDYVAITIPGEQLVPVADLRAGFRMRLNVGKLLTQRTSLLEKAIGAVSTETVARVEEKSTTNDASDIYLMHLSRFRNDSTTISGTNLFTQDVYLFETDPAFSLRFRFNERKGLVRLVGITERSYFREQSVRLRSQLLREIGNQTEFTDKTDELFPNISSPRQRDLSSDELRTEFSYRPYSEWDVSFGAALSGVTNRYGGADVSASINEQFVRLTYAILSLGQLRTEIQREEVLISNDKTTGNESYPFEFTNGKAIGKTFQWHLACDYRISRSVQLTFSYDGRSEGGSPAVHTARAEARAFF
jgi:hypothetical protein